MSCNSPLKIKNKDGTFRTVSCRWCMGCRIARRNEWATRIRLECFSYMKRGIGSSFVTVTYDDNHYDGSVHISDIQKLNKRLRYYLRKDNSDIPADFKFYISSEYGTETDRGHYHGIYMGLPSTFLSEYLRKAWKNGFVAVYPVSFSRIRYVLKYLDKQLRSSTDISDYVEKYHREPPSAVMSHGIGTSYFYNNLEMIREKGGIPNDKGMYLLSPYYSKKFGVDTDYGRGNLDTQKQRVASRYGMSVADYNAYKRYCDELCYTKKARLGGFSPSNDFVDTARSQTREVFRRGLVDTMNDLVEEALSK